MKILKFHKLNGWYPIDMTMELEVSFLCPCCTTDKRKVTLLVIVELLGKQRIRLGICDWCGYMGYIDRPTKAWFDKFYSEKWDTVGQVSPEDNVVKLMGPKLPVGMIAHLTSGVKADKNRPVLDIGCGFGFNLRSWDMMGFKDVNGVESSNHRAKAVQKIMGYNVTHGDFESVNLDKAPYNLIAHHHVLEHIHDPQAFIKKCSDVQKEGDYMVLSVPNNLGEPTLGVTLYLPHIHSFTVTGLTRLLGLYSYEVVDWRAVNQKGLNFIAIKRNKPLDVFVTAKIHAQPGAQKIIRGFDLRPKSFFPKRLMWNKFLDNAKQYNFWENPKIEDLRSLVIRQGKATIPLKIEYKGNVKMFVK